MTGKERTIAALNGRQADRVPRYWPDFWPEFIEAWTAQRGVDPYDHFDSDVRLVIADETVWPSKAGLVRMDGNDQVVRTGWGALHLKKHGFQFTTTLEPALPERIDPDTLVFDDPRMDSRYTKAAGEAAAWKDEYFTFCKTGGPYLRAAFMRGEENFWVDVAEDPGWTKAFVDRVADHITAIGVESIKRFGLQDSGIAIYDDVAAIWGPFVNPLAYEKIFLPALKRMVGAYKAAGAAKVMHHSDGNVLPMLDMWVEAGIDAINPVEYRTGMDPVKIKEQYGNRLICVGGLDNCEILPRGNRDEIRQHVLHVLQAGLGGGLVIGPHSIGTDVTFETMDYVLELLNEYGTYPLKKA